MLSKQKLKSAKSNITRENEFITDSEGNAIISIKAAREEQIFSEYSYDSDSKLNENLAAYILDSSKYLPLAQDIKLKVYTSKSIDADEVTNAIKFRFRKEYVDAKNQIHRNSLFSLAMLIAAILTLGFLFLMNAFFYNLYLWTIFEIVAWVFAWEATDSFFLQRTGLRRHRLTMLKLYSAGIEIIKLENLK